MTLSNYMKAQREFSLVTFGPGLRTKGILDHIRKECEEVEQDPLDSREWIDIALLAFDGAWRSGLDPDDFLIYMYEKLEKNKKRNWPDWRGNQDRAIEHIREEF